MTFGPLTVGFDATVLRPRPWTLAQAEWAAQLAATAADGPLLELASGAGHIGQAAAVLARRALVQVDASAEACTWARRNAEQAGIAERVDVRCGRFGDALATDERFPVVIADPPYVPTAEIGRFPDDPQLAIDGGPDGLDAVAACLDAAAAHVAPAGAVVLQVRGSDQATAIAGLCAPLRVVEVRSYGPDRALVLLEPR